MKENIMNIDLSEYKLVKPESIVRGDGINKFYDIEVEDDHTFYIGGENDNILTHNCDGNSIAGLLLNFFNKYWPDLFDRNMVYKVETPIVVTINKKSKKKLLFYTQTEYNEWSLKEDLKLWEIKYKKGLAALVDDEYQEIINNPKLTKITKDELSDEYLDIWFGKNSELRKNQILN
jgi:DNA gyrase/topoisomerase IV subunit B